ncbi:Alpha/Beta hydrolase protein [Sphaerosporella brunnea]|uniref:Carboxylic ester hydrolase n=1 Tax=Sphaerosporella brunnea TaxID=1250544 RepID=A0A5J5ERE7_9PEZI|nr:Alpha/Beta hydrolase protein [Sphaerosporella brunnea]
MKSSVVFLLSLAGFATANDPTARLPASDTTYVGRYLPQFDQDAFLGITYASPKRFNPATLLAPPKGKVTAQEYGFSCPAYGSDTTTMVASGTIKLGEDCLNLNVIRPSGVAAGDGLPVAVWIYGGGWQQGSSADTRYNLSYIVEHSVKIGKPMIGVSMNYRLAGFGFLFSQEVMNSGNTNLGLRDQRTALYWVQKNIRAFGGDPRKVTIWGESAGASSVGNHLLAYGGRDDKLFRAAILQSGTAAGPPHNDTRWYQPLYDQVTAVTGCDSALDTLDCLRNLPYETLYPALDVGSEWFPTVDGDMIRSWPSTATREGRFVKVPLLVGSNTDEGISFGVTGVNTDAEALAQLIASARYVLTTAQAQKLLSLYPNVPALGSPYGTGNRTWPNLGLQWKRYASMAGDLTMVAPRRLLASEASKYSSAYSYRFDAPLPNNTATSRVGVGHFQDVPYVMANPAQTYTPLGNDTRRLALAHKMAGMWATFVSDGNPGDGWPMYSREEPRNFVFRSDQSYVEEDDYRIDGMEFINSLLR